MTVADKADIHSPPAWWKPGGDRVGLHGFGCIEGGYLRQSEEEALAWARSRLITPSTAGLTGDDIAAISAYSDPGNYQRINSDFYRRRETRINAAIRAALSKCVIPDRVIAWRGAGFKLYRYPEQGPRIFAGGPQRAIGRIFDHRPPVSTSVGNGPVTIGLRQHVWYKLRIDPGVYGVFIPEIAVQGYEERELLLAPGTHIRIDKANLVGDRWYVLATALARCSPDRV